MTTPIPAIYEGGVLRPLAPVDLKEQQRVYLVLLPEDPASVVAAQRAALEEIIGLGESCDADTSVRHDELLYSRPR